MKNSAPRLLMIIFYLLVALNPIKTASGQSNIPFFIADCGDGRQVIGHRLLFEDLPSDEQLRVTIIGVSNFDPSFAILNGDDEPECITNTQDATGSTVAVPSTGRIEANSFSAQRSIRAGSDRTIDIIAGGFAGQSGQYILVVENLGINEAGEPNSLRMQIPPSTYQEWVNVFMIGEAERIDPVLLVYEGEAAGLPSIECDNAGTSTCEGTSSLIDRGAVINEVTYVGDDFDAGIMDVYSQSEITYTMRDASTATGDYILIITATAPGAVASSTFICDRVEVQLLDSSPLYNPAYTLESILDGNPDTFWVTGAPPLNPDGTRSRNAFIVFSVLDDRAISRIRINGYAQALGGIEQNSLQRFALQFPTAVEGELVTALESEVDLHAGYQTFNFLPTVVDEFGLVLQNNYGGTLYVIVDVQVCAN